MYTLDCPYYTKSFNTLEELVEDILTSGMDPNYEILFNGEKTHELAINLLSI